jgi:DNA-binding NtrC family response regulator
VTLTEAQPSDLEGSGHDDKTVLLLDDDATTLLVLHAVLERTNTRVIECEDEKCAIRRCNESGQCIDLLVADVVLKRTNGPAVAKQIRLSQPLMRLLFISGFSLTELERRGLLGREDMVPGRVEFLQKPFAPEVFLETVEKLLSARRTSGTAGAGGEMG